MAKKYQHTLITRILHLIHMVSMIVLILTGFYIYAPLSFNVLPSMDIARFLHFIFMYLIVATLIFKFYYVFVIGEIHNLLFTWNDLKQLPRVIQYYVFGIFTRKIRKKEGKYNAGQKLLYTAWPLLLILQALTGFAMYFPEFFADFNVYFGGVENCRAWHAIAAWLFTITTVVHVYLGTTGTTLWSFYKSMVTGYEQ